MKSSIPMAYNPHQQSLSPFLPPTGITSHNLICQKARKANDQHQGEDTSKPQASPAVVASPTWGYSTSPRMSFTAPACMSTVCITSSFLPSFLVPSLYQQSHPGPQEHHPTYDEVALGANLNSNR